MKPSDLKNSGAWRYRVVRSVEGRKVVPAAENARLSKKLREEKEPTNVRSV